MISDFSCQSTSGLNALDDTGYLVDAPSIPLTNKECAATDARSLARPNADLTVLQTALRAVVKQVCYLTDWNIGEVWFPDNDHSVLTCSSVWHSQNPEALHSVGHISEHVLVRPGVGLPGRVWVSGQSEWVPDVSAQPENVFIQPDAAPFVGLKAGLGLPILADGCLVAVLVFFMFEPRQEDHRLVGLVSAIAAQLGAVIQLQQAEAALREKEERFRAIFENAAIGIGLTSLDGFVLDANLMAADMFGYSIDEFRHKHFADFTHPDDVTTDLTLFQELLRGDRDHYQIEKRYIHKTGNIFWCRLTVAAVRSVAGELQFTFGMSENITEQKRMEQALCHSEDQFRAVFNSSAIAIGLTDINGQLIGANPLWHQLFGYTPEEVPFLTVADITHPDDLALDLETFSDLLVGKQDSFQLEKRYVRKNGEVFWGLLTCSAVRGSVNQSFAAFGMVQDITKRKQTEEALRHSETYNRDLLRAIPEMLFVISDAGIYLYAQAEQEEDLLQPLDQLIGQSLEDVLPAEVAQQIRQKMALTRQTGRLQTYDYALLLQGEERYFEARLARCGDRSCVLTARNITDRKRVERALQEKEAFLRLILDNIPQYIFWKDRNLVYQGANQLFAESAGLASPSDVIGKTDVEVWDAVQAEMFQASDRQVIETNIPFLHLIRPKTYADGRKVWQDVSKVPIHDADGTVIGVLGTYEDITEQRRAEEALAQREQYLATLVEVQQQLLVCDSQDDIHRAVLGLLGDVADASRVYVFNNSYDASGRLLMSQKGEWCAAGIAPQIDHPLLQNLLYADTGSQQEELLSQGKVYSGTVATMSEAERAILEPRGILSILLLPLIVNGEFFGFIGFDNCVEIRVWEPSEVDLLRAGAAAISLALERLQANAALRRSEARYRLLAENSTDLIARYLPTGVYCYASPACRALLGYEPREMLGRSHLSFIHPQDVDLVRHCHAQTLAAAYKESPEASPFRYRIRCKNGEYLWFETKGKAILDLETGQVNEIIATSRDITERKQAENLLAGQKQILEMIATNANLPDVLNGLVQFVETQIDGILCSIVLLDADGVHLRHGAAPNLPADYIEQINGLAIGLNAGSCGAAMYQRQPVVVNDIAHHPYWNNHRDLALRHNLRSCWSVPIFSAQGTVLGSLALYHRYPCEPIVQDWQLLEMSTRLAGIAIEQNLAEEALQSAEIKYRGIFENAVEGIFQSTLDGHYITVNPMLARLYGYDSPEDLSNSLTNIQQQLYVDPNRRIEFMQIMAEQREVLGFESEVYRKDGSIIWISESARALYNAAGNLVGYEGTADNITRRKRVELALLNRDNLLQGVAAATSCLLTNTDSTLAIPQALAILGEAARVDRVYIYQNHLHSETGELAMSMSHEWVRSPALSGIHQPHWQSLPYSTFSEARWYETFAAGQTLGRTAQQFCPAEREVLEPDSILSLVMVPIFIEEEFWGYIGFDDCQSERQWSSSEESILVAIAASIGGAIKRQRTEEQMRHQAFHDALTGLPNRMMFNQRLYLTLARARRTGESFAVMFLDLDHFKTINDTLGHAIGDQLLEQSTQRLMSCLREEDTIARWGGDEFTLLFPEITSVEAAAKIAQRISYALKPVFCLENHELHVTSSIGVALYPQDGKDAQTLIKNADAALYRAKDRGRDNYQFYTPTLNSKASERLTLDSSLHYALERNEFSLYYQPQINILTGEVTQMEALLRWQHPKLGVVAPQTFISLAEDNGLIVPIGAWVLRMVCTQIKTWQVAGLAPLRVAVNLSARQFQQPNLVEQIAQVLAETGVSATCLELEITETAAMRDVEFTTILLNDLRLMGIRIVLDDFGTGYSSLGYLKKFPLHALKIDRSFIQDLADSPDDVAIITAIMALGRGLNLRVIAEGVETSDQLAKLRSLQCEEIQGYLFSRPLNVLAATQFLQRNQPHANLERLYHPT